MCVMRLTDVLSEEQESHLENGGSLACERLLVCMKTLVLLNRIQGRSLAMAPRGCRGAVKLKFHHSWVGQEKETADAGPRIRE